MFYPLLNSSGTPLFKRGYRKTTGDAPINEILAAGMIQLSEWDGKTPFIDPMCGSGTSVYRSWDEIAKHCSGYLKR